MSNNAENILRRCICNDSRGTDCDYCGGKGWITEKIRLFIVPSEMKDNSEKIGRYVWKDVRSHITPIPRKKKFDQRIIELQKELKDLGGQSSEKIIIYLGEKIKKLYLDIKALEPKVQKKQKNHFKTIKKKSIQLIKDFDSKFPKQKLQQD